MKKIIATMCTMAALFGATALHAQIVVQVNAGSRAPWGEAQQLTIDKKGKCHYVHYDVSAQHILDSATFTITKAQLDTFFKKADEVGFYGLQKDYHKGIDGEGLFISLSDNGKNGTVDLLNTDIPQVNALVATLNGILQPRSIKIYYGQK